MSEIPVFQVLGAAESGSDSRYRQMRLGWRSSPDGLLIPGKALPCQVLHLSGALPPVPDALVQLLRAECRRVGADGVFLDIPPESASLADTAARLARLGCTVYGRSAAGGMIPTYLEAERPESAGRFAVSLTRRATLTTLGSDSAVRQVLSPSELQALLRRYAPQVAFSRELAANYCTLATDQGTQFLLFDTDETMQFRLLRLAESGAVACFL